MEQSVDDPVEQVLAVMRLSGCGSGAGETGEVFPLPGLGDVPDHW